MGEVRFFEHRSHYPFPRDDVFTWHTRPGGFLRLTPPGWAEVRQGPTAGIDVGSESVLRITDPILAGLGPRVGGAAVGVDWLVRHVALDAGRMFADEQARGPFRRWRHEHHFEDAPDGTVVTDVVEWDAPAPAHGFVETRLRRLFAFRERQLRGDLTLASLLPPQPQTVILAGASGLVGGQLSALLGTLGHRVIRLVRRPPLGADEKRWDPAAGRLPSGAFEGADVVVNLSGHTIGGRFSAKHKRLVMDSRIEATSVLSQGIADTGGDLALIQASAIGIYGARRPGEVLTEESSRGPGFLADVVAAWERAASPARDAGSRAVFLRTGVALSLGGGALLPQIPLYLLGAGGRMAAADAWLSWITVDDLARAYAHAALTPGLRGPVNAVAPAPVTQAEFASTLGRVLRRPAWLPTPSLAPRAMLGSEGYDQLIDTDQRVSAETLLASGFHFAEPELAGALRHVTAR